MKLLFIFSCLLNVIFAAYWLLNNNTVQHAPIIEAGKGSSRGVVQTIQLTQPDPMTNPNIESGPYQSEGESENDDLSQTEKYLHLKGQLLAIDIPESTVDIVLMSMISQDFSKKVQVVKNPADFWASRPLHIALPGALSPQPNSRMSDLNRERMELMNSVLGEDFQQRMIRQSSVRSNNLDFLSKDKVEAITNFEQQFGLKMLKSIQAGAMANPNEYRKLEREKQDAIAELLGDELMEEYQLRKSQTANQLRHLLTGFNTTEDEFRAIFRIRKAYDDKWHNGNPGVSSGAVREDRQLMDQQVADYLGEERYQEYVRIQDSSYKVLKTVTEQSGLSEQSAIDVYTVKKNTELEAVDIRSSALSREEKTLALNGLREDAENAVISLLGQEIFESYKKNRGTFWLDMLSTSVPSISSGQTVILRQGALAIDE